ncbi:MAG: hypothetical protein AABY55_04335, partial [Candidatus Omnitrophota bacterium]
MVYFIKYREQACLFPARDNPYKKQIKYCRTKQNFFASIMINFKKVINLKAMRQLTKNLKYSILLKPANMNNYSLRNNTLFKKTLSLIIAQVFLFINIAYPAEIASTKTLLRPVLQTSQTGRELLGFNHSILHAPQKINLSPLIGALKELAKHGHDNDYYLKLINSPDKLAELVNAFKGSPQRVDTLIHQQASYGYQAAIELIANGIDALMIENNMTLIGRFGIGAFQSLAELEEKGDYVSWTSSSDGKQAIRITITKGDGENEYYYQSKAIKQGIKKGTAVIVHKARYTPTQQKALEEYIRSKLRLNYRCPIYVNGVLINPLEDVLFINGDQLNYLVGAPVLININEHGYTVEDPGIGMDCKDMHTNLLIPHRGKELPRSGLSEEAVSKQTKVFYIPQKRTVNINEELESEIHLQVGGVIIESFKIKGYSMPKDLVIELPAATDLTEDRQHIQLSAETTRALKSVIDKIVKRDINNQVEIINGIAYMLGSLSQRDEKASDLLQYMSNLAREWRKKREEASPNRYVYMPNEKGFFHTAIPEGKKAVYINNNVLAFNPENVPGSERIPFWDSNKYSMWALLFTAESDVISFEFGNLIILNKSHYNAHKYNPSPLDLEINPIVTGYEPPGYAPERKGRLLPYEEKMPEKERIEEKYEGMPIEIKKALDKSGLPKVILQKIKDKLSLFFNQSPLYPPETIKDITVWLNRLDEFSHVVSIEDLSTIIDSFILEPIEPIKPKDYTKVHLAQKYQNP